MTCSKDFALLGSRFELKLLGTLLNAEAIHFQPSLIELSMFAQRATSSARSSAGYICLACRHERVVIARQSRQQRRWNSETAKASSRDTGATASTESADDWLLPLNDLTEDYGDKKKEPDRKEASTKTSRRKDRSIDDLRASLSGHVDGDGGVEKFDYGGGLTRKQRRREEEKRRASSSRLPGLSRPKDIPGLLQSLDQANGGEQADADGVNGIRGVARTRKSGSTQAPSQISTKSSNPEMQALWDSLGPGLRAEIDELAADRSKEDSEAQYDEYLEKSAAVSVPDPEVKSKEPVPFPSFASKESSKAAAPSTGFFSSTLNYFKESFGLSKPSQPKQAEPESKQAGPKQAQSQINARPKPSQNATQRASKQRDKVESTFDTIKLPRNVNVQKSPVERYEESKSRQPWGPNPSTSSAPTRRVAFEDMASADRVSAKKPIATAFSPRPFGSEPANTIAGLRGQLAQTLAKDEKASPQSSAKAAEATEAIAPPAHSRLSELYATRAETETATAEMKSDGEDTFDLAYLRRQYDQDRVQQDIKESIRKTFAGIPLTPEVDVAVKEEAHRAVEGKSRAVHTPDLVAPSQDVSVESKPALKDKPPEGLSLGAAMRAGPKSAETSSPKRRAGRPAKESPSRVKSKAAMKQSVENEEMSSKSQESPIEAESKDETKPEVERYADTAMSIDGFKTSSPSKLHITPLDIPQPPVPFLQYGLDRVLFNPGVYQLQDQASRVYNFDPYLQNIMPNVEFDFDSLKVYKTSSKDEALAAIAKEHGNKYIGSTSSMTSAMGHFHYLLSNWRPLNYGMLSNDFVAKGSKALPTQLTQINRAPTAIFLRWKNGTYAIDADKEHDSANVLMLLGKSMELLLTLPKSEFERYRKSDPREVSEEQRTAPEAYQYTTMGDFLMRSQLDAYDPRLPGNGTFDLKTRAVVSVRMAADDHEPMTGYEIYAQQGKWGSYEKEYFDMMRSTMLKYMLQARMGRMNGIFVAYHNVERMFGFQYLPIADMDRALHGQTDPSLGDQEFRASLDMMNEVLNAATAKFPEQSLRIHFETREEEKGGSGMPTALHVFAEPMSEEDCDKIQNSQKAKIAEWERNVMGKNDTDEPAEAGTASADETTSRDFSNEVVQDDAAVELLDEVAEVAEEDQATAYSRSLLQSDGEPVAEDATATQTSSSSNADPKFLNHLEKTSSEELSPLFYATIIAQSQINGQVVDRPYNLKAEDEWNIDYILKEYETGAQQWAMYEDVKARRKMAYVKEEEEEGVAKEENGYITFLRNLSEKGRALRKAKDEREDGMPTVRVEELDMERLEKVESVEDYMRFLEKPKVEGTRDMFG